MSWLSGMHLVLDREGSVRNQWLNALAGAARDGHLQICGPHAATETRVPVFWQDPRAGMASTLAQQPVSEWIAPNAALWPLWSQVCWAQPVAGFALTEHLHKPLCQLSICSRHKVWLAAGLACGAAVTLIDEPLAALDGRSARYLLQALQANRHPHL